MTDLAMLLLPTALEVRMRSAALSSVLQLSPEKKLARLRTLCPSDAQAVELIIDDCLMHRWPKTQREIIAFAERLSVKH